ncbi:MAG: hypothetical protein JWN44_2301 [Myxococcales bacterium]|nr:hypothetical protein [Myxococcales bacterium]
MTPLPARPTLVAVEMGYGHLRPAHALAERLGIEVLEADRPPLAGADEQRIWARVRRHYEGLTRLSQLPIIGRPLGPILGAITAIPPLYPARDLSSPTWPVRIVDRLAARGLGQGLVAQLRAQASPLITTFFVPALIADRAGDLDVRCVVTDSDINRVWAPLHPKQTRIRYFAPSTRVVRRLMAYGVPQERITLTGFPLPHELLGGPSLPTARANLLRRLARLDVDGAFRRKFGEEVTRTVGAIPEADAPPRITFAVGGAGAQAGLAARFLPSLAPSLRGGRLSLRLVAGVRTEVADIFFRAVDDAKLGALVGGAIEILLAPDLPTYFRTFNAALADTDALWTKPSELSFFAALGLPLVLSPAVGEHERLNARWAVEHGAALKQHDPAGAAHWLADWLVDGTLAQAAWSGFRSLPKQGLYDIVSSFQQ